MAEKIQLEIQLENGQLKVATKEATDSLGSLGKGAEHAEGSFNKLNKTTNLAKTAIKGFIAVKAVGYLKDLYSSALSTAGAFEKQQIAFETLLGSAEDAQRLLNDIKKFAGSTPFQMPGLIETSKQLLAFGTGQDEIIDKMKMLGNASMGNQEVMSRLGLAYGKIQAKGKASLEELNQLTEAGVPIMKELAKQYGVSTTKLFKLVETGKVGFAEVDNALTSMTTGTGQFAGMIEKQSQSLTGMFSTLKDKITLASASIGDGMIPDFKRLIRAFSESEGVAKGIIAIFKGIGTAIATVAGAIALVIEGVDDVIQAVASKNRWQDVKKYEQNIKNIQDLIKKNPQYTKAYNQELKRNKVALYEAEIATKKYNIAQSKKHHLSLVQQRLDGHLKALQNSKLKSDHENVRIQELFIKEKTKTIAGIYKKIKADEDEIKVLEKKRNLTLGRSSTVKKNVEITVSGTGVSSGESEEAKLRKQFDVKKQLLQDFYNYDLSLKTFTELNKQQQENQAVAYYEQILRAKLGLDSRYAKGAATVTSTASTFMAQEQVGLFRFGQALSVAKASQDTASGIMKTMAQWGWPLGLVGAGIIGTAGALNIAQIVKQKPPAPPKQTVQVEAPAFYTGGFIGGSSSGTLITAGDRGRTEAVIPMEDADRMSQLRESLGVNQQPSVIVQGNLYGNDSLLQEVDRLQEERASDMGASKYSIPSVY